MSKVYIDLALTLDGYWADAGHHSIYPRDEIHTSGLIEELRARTGAVVMSGFSFNRASDPDWYADNYELQAPIFVITDQPPARKPKQNSRLSFAFVGDFKTALTQARTAAAGRDVAIIADESAVQAAVAADAADEIWLHIVPRLIGDGVRAFAEGGFQRDFALAEVSRSDRVAHVRLVRLPQ